jgi:hypothetical protein
MVPADEEGYIEERARLSLIGDGGARVHTRALVDTWDAHVRGHFRRHLEDMVPLDRIEPMIDLLRTVTNGITLSAVEHPGEWPAERQFAVIDEALVLLRSSEPTSRAGTSRAAAKV